jgi:uncharacterized membrane protein YqaE (UPF0057 family)
MPGGASRKTGWYPTRNFLRSWFWSADGILERSTHLSLGRVILCILLPPLAVLDKGCGSIVLVTLLTFVGWVPGVLAAMIILTRSR